jgi:hypothetical protein
MSSNHRKPLESVEGNLNATEVEIVLKALMKQLRARKKLYFRHKGVVKDVREVPDHATHLRALDELAKIVGLYPRR